LLGDRREQLIVLMAAAVCVLLISCANVASLLLLRAFQRRGELSVRGSLGATRGAIVRQLVVEGVVLALAGAAVGLTFAPLGTRLLADMVPAGMFPIDVSLFDVRVATVALAMSLLAAVGFSVAPACHAVRSSLVEGLQQEGRSRMSRAGLSRNALVVCQIAIAVVLLVGTGLLLRTFVNLRGAELGFEPSQLLTLRTTLPLTKYVRHSDRVAFFSRVVSEVRSLPGVAGAAYVSTPPFASVGNTSGFLIEGGDPVQRQDALVRIGTADYLKVLGAAIVDGRFLDERDQENAPGVLVVNETFARLHWPGRSAVGRRVSLGAANQMRTIVGVVRDVRERGFEPESKPAAYLVTAQVAGTFFLPETLIVRASADLVPLVPAIRAAIGRIDPEQPISAVRTMDEVLDRDVVDRKQQTTLLGVFASIAVLLGAMGLYAVMAYGVAQQKQEIAVRMAVGATAGTVIRAVALRGQKLVLSGLGVGLVLAWALSRTIATLLRDVSPLDLLTFVVSAAGLWLVALVACGIPAIRAARITPARLLRGN
jgi:predicted permease